ncbi:MAG: nucleotidyltransferase domain-containing protein [Bacteroidota bacterium]|nr:nucleotidyltransferase domain-containing protein [Bacteroidota bacterium]
MKEIEFPPLLERGFKDIISEEMNDIFVKPFSEKSERNKITKEFQNYIELFLRLNVNSEIWIDGSYATKEPNPSDIDIVFFLEVKQVDSLSGEKEELFQKLFLEKKLIKNLYYVDVYYADINSDSEKEMWEIEFGTRYDKETPKGIFRLKVLL